MLTLAAKRAGVSVQRFRELAIEGEVALPTARRVPLSAERCRACDKNPRPKNRVYCDECKQGEMSLYRTECRFVFGLSRYPGRFDGGLIEQYGWYSAANRGGNINGVNRDHRFSVRDGFRNGIPPALMRHPANCQLMRHHDNQKKKSGSCITQEELLNGIMEWEERLPSVDSALILAEVQRALAKDQAGP